MHACLRSLDACVMTSLDSMPASRSMLCPHTSRGRYYDAKKGRYVDFPITDVLQMMGRAGRPQFDDTGKVCALSV